MSRRLCLSFVAVLLLTSFAGAEEWPKWLGPAGNGVAADKIVEQWPAAGPKQLWSKEVGLGFATVVGDDNHIYCLGMQGDKDVLQSLDARSGAVQWSVGYVVTHRADAPQAKNDENGLPVPEATPTIDGDRIYTYGGGGDLYCRSRADGKPLWNLNVLDETGATILAWNASSTPLVAGNLVYVQGGRGGAVAVAVDKTSGKIAWKAQHALGGYAAPILADVEGTSQLIIFGGDQVLGLDPLTGNTLWTYPWKTSYDVNAATPIYHDGHLFITTGYGHGCAMLQVHRDGVKLDWEGKALASKFQPPILDQGLLFGNNGGRLKCLRWPTSKTVWSANNVKLGEGGSFVIDGSQLIALSETGDLSLVHLTAAGPTVVNEVKVFQANKIWSSPVIYHSMLYVKGKTELVCFDISR